MSANPSASKVPFKLSDPGKTMAQDPAMSEYLRCYEFPSPPEVRYGFIRLDSPQPKDRVGLFGQVWLPMQATGTVLLVHGFAEHAGNYSALVRDLVNAHLAVAILDLRGHGLSEGPRGHVEGPDTYAEDIEAFVDAIFPSVLPSRPLNIFGHSLGALTALQVLQRKKLSVKPAGAVLTSPLLGFPELLGAQKYLAALAPIVARVLPTLPIAHGIPPTVLSHDEAYLARRQQDPLISRVATPRWLLSVGKSVLEIQAKAGELGSACPTLLMLAGDEKVTNLDEARRFAFRAYAGLRHKVIEFPGYYHEIEKESGVRSRVVSEAIAWFKSHQAHA
jgi:alpha-beta hydrolase superfamily lysophospholipase